MHECLYNRVVGGVFVSVEGKVALATAVECAVAIRGYDPVLSNIYNQYRKTNQIEEN